MLDKLAAFAEQSTVSTVHVPNGNTPWAQRYASELRDVVTRYAARMPRNLQRHLGPSELGHHCDRQLVGKMAGVQLSGGGNQLHDPWASFVGTAIHDILDRAFTWDATEGINPGRWLTECRVTPDPGAEQPHPGTADLYDLVWESVDDHKCQSQAVRTRLRRNGPPYHYRMQMLLYGVGYMLLGYNVVRIALISWPRTQSTMDDIYVWEHPVTAAEIQEVIDLLDKTVIREQVAKLVASGAMSFWEVPPTPSPDDCEFCPFYNPAALQDGTKMGCPGTNLKRR